MNKVLLIAIVSIVTLTSVKAQSNVIKVDPVGLLTGTGQFSYERVIKERRSLELSLTYTSVDAIFENKDQSKVSGLGVEAKYKMYFSRFAYDLKGWYWAPVASYTGLTGESDNEEQEGKLSVFRGGAILGHQLFLGDITGFTVDFNLGLHYVIASATDDISDLTSDGLMPRVGISIGYAW